MYVLDLWCTFWCYVLDLLQLRFQKYTSLSNVYNIKLQLRKNLNQSVIWKDVLILNGISQYFCPFWFATALRPNSSSPYQIDDKFSLWKQPFVQNALSQVSRDLCAMFCWIIFQSALRSQFLIYLIVMADCGNFIFSDLPSFTSGLCWLFSIFLAITCWLCYFLLFE